MIEPNPRDIIAWLTLAVGDRINRERPISPGRQQLVDAAIEEFRVMLTDHFGEAATALFAEVLAEDADDVLASWVDESGGQG